MKKSKKKGYGGNSSRGEWGSSIPTSSNHKTTHKVIFFVKTKNVPKVLKCKINQFFFSHKHGVPKLGGGGVPDMGKIPTFSCFFFIEDVPYATKFVLACKQNITKGCWNWVPSEASSLIAYFA